MTYWIFRHKVYTWHSQYVQATLISPAVRDLTDRYGAYGFRSALQDEQYGTPLDLVFRVNSNHSHPDYYFDNTSFTLFSERLVNLMRAFDVRAEVFPVTMVDEKGIALHDLHYFVFHSLEGVQPVMDEVRSQWTGDPDFGIPKLILKEGGFDPRPLFKCDHIYVQLMRDDLKQAIRRAGMTGFAFLLPELYRSGKYGFAPDFE